MEDTTHELTQKILQIAMQGEHARGNNGAVLIDTVSNDVVYLLTHEFKPETFCDKLQDMLSEDGNEYIYIVHKEEKAMHISKMKR